MCWGAVSDMLGSRRLICHLCFDPSPPCEEPPLRWGIDVRWGIATSLLSEQTPHSSKGT